MKQFNLFLLMFFWGCLSCQNQTDSDNNQNNNSDVIIPVVYQDDHLSQIEEKLFLQFSPSCEPQRDGNGDWEAWTNEWNEWNALLNSDASLHPYAVSGDYAFLESKDGSSITPSTINYFKANRLVGTVSYPFESENTGSLQGLRNEFVVKLKETTTFLQLQQLAEKNQCVVRDEDPYCKNQFFVVISKKSEMNAMQMLDLFDKTNLFEASSPTFVVLDILGGVCENKRILKVLKDEPAYIRKRCFEHLERKDAFYFELINSHSEFFGLAGALFPFEEIPNEYRKEGLIVKINGNVLSCTVGTCSEPDIRLIPFCIIELKSICFN